MIERLLAEPAVRAVLAALEGGEEEAWIVGGAPRDAALGRPVKDVDLVVRGDPEGVAKRVARSVGGAVFPHSDAFGAWRALARDDGWVCDVTPLHGDGIEADLVRRDFSVNAIAVPRAGGEPVDPTGGERDLEARTLRVLGGPSVQESAYASDPLRPLRLVRLATELALEPDPETERLTREAAGLVAQASPERVFAELRRIVCAERVLDGVALGDRLGILGVVLPELDALHGVEQSHFHHLDVYDHTLEVLRQWLALDADLEPVFQDLSADVRALLDEPAGDELSAAQALRFACLLHDVGKPATRGELPDGRITFIGHDAAGEEMVGDVCRRLRTSERLRVRLQAVTRHHLRLGFMVHERPLARSAVYRYLSRTSPVEAEVTVFTCADRLATRGKNAEAAIAAHLELARALMEEALRWRAEGPPKPPLRGDELARELGIEQGPALGDLLRGLEEACFTGEVESREQAVEYARRLRDTSSG